MASSPAPAVTLDASFIVGYCAKEPKKYLKARAELARYTQGGWAFYAPAVAIAECLFAFCRKLQAGDLTTVEHAKTIQVFASLMQIVLPPPNGEASLIVRAEQIRSGYGCSRSSDSIYLALAEQLASLGASELVTFDTKIDNQAKKNAPTVVISCLPM